MIRLPFGFQMFQPIFRGDVLLVSGSVFVVYKVPLDPDFMIMVYEIILYLTADEDLGNVFFWTFFQAFLETNLRQFQLAIACCRSLGRAGPSSNHEFQHDKLGTPAETIECVS